MSRECEYHTPEDSQTNEGPNPEEERGRQLGGLKCDKERLGNWSSLIIK